MPSTVTIYTLQTKHPSLKERENWFLEREEIGSYDSSQIGESAAEEAYKITNNRNQQALDNFHGPPLNIGDIVRVENRIRMSGDKQIPEYYMCKAFGWEKYDDDVIQLIKYLL